MQLRFLLDTDILIYLRRKRSERRVLALQPGEAAMSVITYGELFSA
jgi:predicted nucleic acid-binding protein